MALFCLKNLMCFFFLFKYVNQQKITSNISYPARISSLYSSISFKNESRPFLCGSGSDFIFIMRVHSAPK